MSAWIEFKARYEKLQDNGQTKLITEPYLVDALSCTEAEARVTDELRPFINGEFNVTSCGKTKISEVFNLDGEGDRFYKAKVNFITIDEKTCAEKKTASYILVRAHGFRTAFENFEDGMKGTMADYELEQLCETKLVDVYKYRVKE